MSIWSCMHKKNQYDHKNLVSDGDKVKWLPQDWTACVITQYGIVMFGFPAGHNLVLKRLIPTERGLTVYIN